MGVCTGQGASRICVQNERHTLEIRPSRGSKGRRGGKGEGVGSDLLKKLLKMTAFNVSVSITPQKSPTGLPYGKRILVFCLEITGTFYQQLKQPLRIQQTKVFEGIYEFISLQIKSCAI